MPHAARPSPGGGDRSFYAFPGPLTALTAEQVMMVRELEAEPQALCRVAQGLLISPQDAGGSGLSEGRRAERDTRPAHALLTRAQELDASPLDHPRSRESRVMGTCRHYAVLATALLRAAGYPARARCGFAAYFLPPQHLDHWITEHWCDDDRRWIRIDPEILGSDVVARPDDLRPGEFLTGGEAWEQVRAGTLDAMGFGVFGTDNWGPGEIRGNLIRDLAALNRVEMLPWDEWGPMDDSYKGRTDDDFDRSMDHLAVACAEGDLSALTKLYDALAVPADLIR